MGPWNFVKGRLYEALGDRYSIERVSRAESGSPATGSKTHPRPGADRAPGAGVRART